jgi:hypothetical protein
MEAFCSGQLLIGGGAPRKRALASDQLSIDQLESMRKAWNSNFAWAKSSGPFNAVAVESPIPPRSAFLVGSTLVSL